MFSKWFRKWFSKLSAIVEQDIQNIIVVVVDTLYEMMHPVITKYVNSHLY